MRTTPRKLQLGKYVLDTGTQRLRHEDSGEEHTLDPKDMSVLLTLADAAPNMVSTEDLLAICWPDMVISDNTLHQVITRLRKVFSDDARQPQYIENLPRRGYRLLAVVKQNPNGDRFSKKRKLVAIGFATIMAAIIALSFKLPSNENLPRSVLPESIQTVAVMPFDDHSLDGSLERLAGGLAAQTIQHLNSVPGIRALSGSILQRLPGRLESANLILTGSVSGEAENVHVSLELADLETGQLLLSPKFTGSHSDPYDLQQNISTRIARYFGESVSEPDTPTSEAWSPYISYQHFAWAGMLDDELYWLEKTLELDPTWVTGWYNYGIQSALTYHFMQDPIWVNRARFAAQKVRSLSPGDWTVQWLHAENAWIFDGDLDIAETAFKQLALNEFPGFSIGYATLLLVSGLHEEAQAVSKNITNAMPFAPPQWEYYALAAELAGDFTTAEQAGRRMMHLLPPGARVGNFTPTLIAVQNGDLDTAQKHVEAARVLQAGTGPSSITNQALRLHIRIFELLIGAQTKDTARMRTVVGKLQDESQFGFAGIGFLILNEPEAAMSAFALAAETPDLYRRQLGHMRAIVPRNIRDHPLLHDFYADLGFTPEWRFELCRRANALPARTGAACDPTKYVVAQDL